MLVSGSLGVREFKLQRYAFNRLDFVDVCLSRRQRVIAEDPSRIVHDNGRDRLRAVIHQSDLDHLGATSDESQSNEQQNKLERFHFFSMTRALNTTPLRLSCSFRGKTTIFQFQRFFLVGKWGRPRKLRST